MPAYRRSKEHRCAGYEEAAKLRKNSKPRQPKKAFTPEEKEKADEEKLARKAAREAKKTWESTLVPWTVNLDFRFPLGTMAMYKSDAKSAYSLTEKEILTLRHESIPGSSKTFFAQQDAKIMAYGKLAAGVGKTDVVYERFGLEELRLFKKIDNSNTSRRRNFMPLFSGYISPSAYRRHRYD